MPSTFAADVIASADGLGEMKLQFSVIFIPCLKEKPNHALHLLAKVCMEKEAKWKKKTPKLLSPIPNNRRDGINDTTVT